MSYTTLAGIMIAKQWEKMESCINNIPASILQSVGTLPSAMDDNAENAIITGPTLIGGTVGTSLLPPTIIELSESESKSESEVSDGVDESNVHEI